MTDRLLGEGNYSAGDGIDARLRAGKNFRDIMRTCWTSPFHAVEPVAAVLEFEQVSLSH